MTRARVVVVLVALLGVAGGRAAGAAPADDPTALEPPRPRVAVFSMVIRALTDGRAAAAFDQDAAEGRDPVLGEVPTRLRLELAAAGLLPPDESHGPDYVVSVMRERDGGPLVAELRSTRPGAAAAALRRQRLVASVQSDAAAVAAIRTVEFVRAAILQDQSAPPQSAPPVPQEDGDEPRKPGLPVHSAFALSAIQGFRGLNTGLAVGGDLGFHLSGPLALRILLAGSVFAREQQVSGGSVSTTQMVLGAGVSYALGSFHGIRPALSLMGGVYVAGISPTPTNAMSSATGPTTSGPVASPFLGLGLDVPLASWGDSSSLRLQVDALFARTTRVIGGDGQEVGRTGSPVMLIGLALAHDGVLLLDGRR